LPAKLPQLSRQIGKGLAEFRRALDDFKRTWEREVNLDTVESGGAMDAGSSLLDKATERFVARAKPPRLSLKRFGHGKYHCSGRDSN
jgi:Sec-independent protein translocase protein TatA